MNHSILELDLTCTGQLIKMKLAATARVGTYLNSVIIFTYFTFCALVVITAAYVDIFG